MAIRFLLLLGASAVAFCPSNRNDIRLTHLYSLPSPEESAKALTDYMAKAHEEKLKAVQAAEEKKQAEIDSLKWEIVQLKQTGGGAIVQSSAPTGTVEDLQQKLISYQNFMAKYIVEAQEAKTRAIREAEQAIAQKYESRLALMGTAPATAANPVLLPAGVSEGSKLYQNRNVKVAAAAAAGKSRWGDAEVDRVSKGNASSAAISATAAPASAPKLPVEDVKAVEAADHGLRSDGGVGGPSLAERIAMGAGINGARVNGEVNGAVSSMTREEVLYHQRNSKVTAAAAMGKSRWGPMEVQKTQELASLSLPTGNVMATAPAVAAADHGLRADGGVGGPSLAERVNLGAKLLAQKK